MYGVKQWNKGRWERILNYTVDFSALANRPGISAADEASYWGVPLATTTAF
jgi:hypothetical protein